MTDVTSTHGTLSYPEGDGRRTGGGLTARVFHSKDDQSIRDLVSQHLGLQGFEDVTPADGNDAMKLPELIASI